VGLALVLLVLGAAADRRVADRERTALLAGVQRGEAALSAARDSQLSLAQYAGPLLTGADVPPAARRSAFATLAQDAARWAATAAGPAGGGGRPGRPAVARRVLLTSLYSSNPHCSLVSNYYHAYYDHDSFYFCTPLTLVDYPQHPLTLLSIPCCPPLLLCP
jgi:hypothetical protein